MCSADIDNLVISLKISLKAFKYCLVCGTSYKGKIALALNHFLSSTCFSANKSVFELVILPSVDHPEKTNFDEAEHDLHEAEPDPHESELNDHTSEISEEGLRLKDEKNSICDEEERKPHNQTENFSPTNEDDNFFSDNEIAPVDGDEPDDSITEDLNSLPRNVVPCDECDSYFSSNIQLNYHKQFTHRESFSCDICEDVSSDLSDLMNHIKSRHKNVNSCFLCQLEIKDVYRHLKSHIGKREFSCSFEGCSQRFVHSESVSKHARVHTAKQFSCHICSMLLAKPASLRNHLSVIHGLEDTFQCGYCQQWFRSYKNLVEHTQSDHSSSTQNKVPCEECGVKFTLKGLQEHRRKKHYKPKKERGRKPGGKKRKRSGKNKSESSDPIDEEAENREHIITCPKCGAMFNSAEKDSADHHLEICEINGERSDPGKQIYSCSHLACSAFFKSVDKLEYHEMFVHSSNPPNISCTSCLKSFEQDFVGFSSHLTNFHKGENLRVVCVVCGAELSMDSVRQHYTYHVGDRKYSCLSCGLKFMESRSLRNHEKSHLGLKETVEKVPCDECGKHILKNNLKYHMKNKHSAEKSVVVMKNQFSCLLCGHGTRSSWSKLVAHLDLHAGKEDPNCCTESGCENIHFSNLQDWHSHFYVVHKQCFQCEFCNILLKNNTFYQTHRNTHLSVREHECSFCKKAFKTKVQLEIHQARHTGQGKYECGICGKRFPQRGELKNHEEQHVGLKGYTCDLCGKTFVRDSYLRLHMKTHKNSESHKNGKKSRPAEGLRILVESTSDQIPWSNTFILP